MGVGCAVFSKFRCYCLMRWPGRGVEGVAECSDIIYSSGSDDSYQVWVDTSHWQNGGYWSRENYNVWVNSGHYTLNTCNVYVNSIEDPKYILVKAESQYRTFFPKIIGIEKINVHAQAQGRLRKIK